MQEGDGGNQFTYTPTNPVATQEVQPQMPAAQQVPPPTPEVSVQWQASEFIDHEKSGNWFVLLALASIIAAAIIYLMSRSIFSSIVVLCAAMAFAVTAKQKPRTMQYALHETGLQIGDKQYKYDDFRSFSIMQDGALASIFLEPTKRFMPSLTIYFDPQDGEKIFDILATQIPHEQRTLDSFERFLKQIRF